MNCGNLWNNLSNLPVMNYNNNNLIGEGEGLDIHYLIDMHGRNGFDAIPRIRCLVDEDRRVLFNKSTGQGTPIEHALSRGYKNIANAIVNYNNGLNIIRDIVGSKRITAQKVKVIKLVLAKKIPIPADTAVEFIKRLSKGNRTSPGRMEIIKNLQRRVNQRAFRSALKNAKGLGSLPPELKKLIAEKL
jgi:hypothetical protein